MTLKKVTLLLILIFLCITTVNGYIVTLSVQRTVSAGEVVIVNGTSNLPSGLTTSIVIYREGSFGYILEKEIIVQEGGVFTTRLDTKGMEEGTYKLEILETKNFGYGSGSVTWRFLDIIDRRNELSLTAPFTQTYDGSLSVSGKISTVGKGGLKVSVQDGGTTIFGPEYIRTSMEGSFEIEVPIPREGMYTITLVDNRSYRWTVQYNALPPSPTIFPVTPTTTVPLPLSASLRASRSEPAFFKVTSNQGVLRASTSQGVDWVMEYIDEGGVRKKVNIRGIAAEELTIPVSGGILYFKIYPDRFDDQEMVTLYVENARAVEPCSTCADLFEKETIPTEQAPLPFLIAILAILCVIAFRKL